LKKFTSSQLILVAALMVAAALSSGCHPALNKSTSSDSNDVVTGLIGHISVSSPNVADGLTPALVTIRIQSFIGSKISGLKLKLMVIGEENTIVPCSPSDDRGFSTCKVYSTRSEQKIFKVFGPINLSKSVMFQPVRPYRSLIGITSSDGADTPSIEERARVSLALSEAPSLITQIGESRFDR
jgi:hypothetical protein